MSLSAFHPIIAQWFQSKIGQPTDVQAKSWPAIRSGSHVLIAAPTGSGKTLAAFLSCIDSLFQQALAHDLQDRTQVVYVSPLKALSNDVQKNLQRPLAEISEAALAQGFLLPKIRVTVRTGDTPTWERQAMLKRPPHILITTPESLYLLLTAEKSRKILRDVRTVIVDEIHAVAPNKRGSHLSLSLERLEQEANGSLTRIGLSATQRPIETIAQFLVGQRKQQEVLPFEQSVPEHGCHIINVGHRREMDMAVEVPKDELGAVATNAIWSDMYDRVAELVREHQSTLVFVNTRRLAERVAHHLEERLQDLGSKVVAAHHGSLSRDIRLSAEERLKEGQTRVVVATASLELGIDVGTVDLVCQIGSPRAIAVGLQRIGRAGHWVGAIPKGRLFPSTRDDLMECAALIRSIRNGLLDQIEVPSAPLDILSQQLVASVATQEWGEDELFEMVCRAYAYRDLKRKDYDAVISMLANGIATRKGRGLAYLHHDRINKRLRARRGARLAAITSGGAIADTANYTVIAEPDGTMVGTVDEDFAVESLAGDIILLGTSSWRIRGVGKGTVRVEDAHGAPPTIPFWRGEAPARTAELSAAVAELRGYLEGLLVQNSDGPDQPTVWLQQECRLDRRGAEQLVDYLREGRAILGVVPTQRTIVAERFFDEGGGMQLVLHTPFGGRINRAWGLALRKRFCVSFDFELQAAATDDGMVISLGERHSFPLASVFQFLQPRSVQNVLNQAILAAPMFATRWRWNATRALAMLRFSQGKRVPPQIQRMRAEDLLAAVFPAAVACQENLKGEAAQRTIPDHPLVAETVRDCLTEAMDIVGLKRVLEQLEEGTIHCVAIDTPTPSAFSHEILNANPYAFLDDAPLEERRARAVEMRRSLPPDLLDSMGTLDASAIIEVTEEAWPVVRDADELHDALLTLIWVPESSMTTWLSYVSPLIQEGRAVKVAIDRNQLNQDEDSPGKALAPEGKEQVGYVSTEFLGAVQQVFPGCLVSAPLSKTANAAPFDREEAIFKIIQGWMESIGPTTVDELATKLGLSTEDVQTACLRLEADGQILRGWFRQSPQSDSEKKLEEWCHRRLLARIHRRTIGRLRKEIQPVTAQDFMQFLFQWHHITPGTRLHGEAGLEAIIRQLAGFDTASSAWERFILPLRLSKYSPTLLDQLCLKGVVAWGRLIPVQRMEREREDVSRDKPRRVNPTSLAPISFFPREDAAWMLGLVASALPDSRSRQLDVPMISSIAQDIVAYLSSRGASFFSDITQGTSHLASAIELALWELVAAGLVTSDSFDNLRALLDPRRRKGQGSERTRRPRQGTGRWSLLRTDRDPSNDMDGDALELAAWQLLRRYGIVFRDLLKRETLNVGWRDLLVRYRRMELRGEIRGGRFVEGFTGEQFGLPEALESLRSIRKQKPEEEALVRISATDPLNLVGIILPGQVVPAVPSNSIIFQSGLVHQIDIGRDTLPFPSEIHSIRLTQK